MKSSQFLLNSFLRINATNIAHRYHLNSSNIKLQHLSESNVPYDSWVITDLTSTSIFSVESQIEVEPDLY